MADEQGNDSVAETATTPGAAEPVETAAPTPPPVETSNPFDRAEPWGNFGKEPEVKAEEPATVEEPAPEKTDTDKSTEPTDKKEGEEAAEKPLEDQVLDEVFEVEKDDKDLDAQDREKMLAGQRNPTARAWAERQEKMAEPIKMLRYPDKKTGEFAPIADVVQKLEEFNPERFAELSQFAAHKLVDTNPEGTFQRAYAIKMLSQNPNLDLKTLKIPSLDDVINGVVGAPAVDVPDLKELTAGLDKEVGWDWRDESLDTNFVDDRELAMAKTLRGMEAKVKADTAAAAALIEERDALKAQTEAKPETEQQVKVRTKLYETIGDYRKGVKDKLLPYIARNTGLEVSKDDTPEITEWKQRRMLDYTGTEYEQANNIDSKFESFAYNESSVKTELDTLTKRVVDLQLKESQALVSGDTASADKYHRAAEDERVPLFTLLAQANKEFKAKFIAPDLDLIGKLSSKLADPIKDASERVEVVSNAGTAPASPVKKVVADTAEGVWDSIVTESAKEDALRAGA